MWSKMVVNQNLVLLNDFITKLLNKENIKNTIMEALPFLPSSIEELVKN